MGYYTNERLEIQNLIPHDTNSILDVGCGSGTFAFAVKKRLNCEAWGVEPNELAANEAREVLDRVYNGYFDLKLINTIEKKFDVICFNDVLEHMTDPYQILENAKSLLNPSGIVIASMPNILHYQEFFDILVKKDFKYQDFGILDKTHFRFFTKKSMVRMFNEAGYRVEKVIGLDPTPSKKMRLISILSFGYFDEMKFPQFAIIAKCS